MRIEDLIISFYLGQICGNDFDSMDASNQQDILVTTIGDFVVEPSLTIPMTIGMYSRWGSGKSTYMQRLMGKFYVIAIAALMNENTEDTKFKIFHSM